MIRCDLCPHQCVLKEGQTGFCHQRINKEGSIVLKDYGAITSLSLDPIEKKPLYHFYPNTKILSDFTQLNLNTISKYDLNAL